MAIVSFDKDTVVDFVPEFGGNRETDDPCVVQIKFVSYARAQYYSRMIAQKVGNTSKSSKIADIAQGVQKRQFTENVNSISGYFIGSQEISDVEEFYDTADTELITEIIHAMESSSKLSEGQLKNFERVSDGIKS